ncbi:MAG: phytoene/squalene synthase family protein [Halarchaeum sp.]
MPSSDDVATSKAIQQRTGATFHVATRLLPERVRHATYVLYAFFRVVDEIVDDPDGDAADQERELARVRSVVLDGEPTDDAVLAAFCDLRETYDIDDEEVRSFLDAMAMDVDPDGYDTHDDLSRYLRGSAVAVGYMMLDVMADEYDLAADDVDAARPHARALGEAFQLTNFLRDVREDVREYGRVYLPRATLDAHDVDESEVRALSFSARFADAMRAELRRTERRYREGVEGIAYLPEDCQFGVLLAAVLYADHHRLIRERGYDTLSARPTLSTPRRLYLAATTWYHWRRTGDPVEAFYAASALSRPGTRHEGGRRARRTGAVRTRARRAVSSLRGVWE